MAEPPASPAPAKVREEMIDRLDDIDLAETVRQRANERPIDVRLEDI